MTDTSNISNAAKQRAEKLCADMGGGGEGCLSALARLIQTTSDVAKEVRTRMQGVKVLPAVYEEPLQSLILPDDEPDPLEELAERFAAESEPDTVSPYPHPEKCGAESAESAAGGTSSYVSSAGKLT